MKKQVLKINFARESVTDDIMTTEDQLEQLCIDWFKELDWEYECGYDIAPDSENPKRKDYKEVLIVDRLRDSLIRINPDVPQDKIDEIVLLGAGYITS